MMETLYVVPSLKAEKKLADEARQWALSIGAVYVPRQKRTTTALRCAYGDNFLVYTTQGPKLFRPEGTHVFSLHMAELRIQQLRRGGTDHFLEAVGAEAACCFLDCTCGFGADSVVASFALPPGSSVAALEISPVMAAVTGWGFAHFQHDQADVTAALRRIVLHRADFRRYLRALPDKAYDVIYMDPMFDKPVLSSCQFRPVRDMLDADPLTLEDIQLALRKAGKKVVIKGRYFHQMQEKFPQVKIYGGKYSRIHYAVWEVSARG